MSLDRYPAENETAAATFSATLVDEWIRAGSTAAFIAPGSRSTPLALALAERPEVTVSMFHDERSAAFAALGWGMRTGRPGIALCSSGTAGAHFYAAVIEASLSAVPLMAVTADRPPELWDVGSAQTIDQTHLFGSYVRWFAQPGVAEWSQSDTWRSWASRAVAESLGGAASGAGGPSGPVHLNLSFRDPLAGLAGDLPPGRPEERPWHVLGGAEGQGRDHSTIGSADLPTLAGRDGVIVAGGGTSDPEAVVELAERLGWPLLADHRSGCRRPNVSIAHFDGLLRHERFASDHRPDVVVRFGEPLASKALNQWLADSGAELIVAAPRGRWLDPDRQASVVLPEFGLAASLLGRLPISLPVSLPVGGAISTRAASWRIADAAAAKAIDAVLGDDPAASDPGVARAVLSSLLGGSALVVASSMAVRELEWFGANRSDVAVYANRGANGIDGTIATAIGIASTGVATTCLLGDIAFLHDATSLTGLSTRPIDLTIVVLDNDGGAIFGFLPQHDLVPPEKFELLFGTPHGTDLAALARAHHLAVAEWGSADLTPDGVRVVIARTDCNATLGLHRSLNAVIAAAIDG